MRYLRTNTGTYAEGAAEQVVDALDYVCWIEVDAHGLAGDMHEELMLVHVR